MSEKISLKTLKPLHTIGKLIGILPTFDTKTIEKCAKRYFFGIFALLFILAENLYSIIGRSKYIDDIQTSFFVTLFLADFVTAITNVMAIVKINLLNSDRLHKFLNLMQELEMLLAHVEKDGGGKRRCFYAELIIGHILFIIYAIYDVWIWSHLMGWELGQYSLLRDIHLYHIVILVLLIRNYVRLIKYKLEAVNSVLRRFGNAKNATIDKNLQVENLFVVGRSFTFTASGNLISSGLNEIKGDVWTLERISAVYNKISNAIDAFNDVFGWILMILEVQFTVAMLNPLNLALVYGGGDFLGKQMGLDLYVLCFIWFVIPLVNMIGVISACDRTKVEGGKITKICYTLMAESQDEGFKGKLKDLATQGSLQPPLFTAAGFFQYDYSMVFPTFTSLISYFIVLIQIRS